MKQLLHRVNEKMHKKRLVDFFSDFFSRKKEYLYFWFFVVFFFLPWNIIFSFGNYSSETSFGTKQKKKIEFNRRQWQLMALSIRHVNTHEYKKVAIVDLVCFVRFFCLCECAMRCTWFTFIFRQCTFTNSVHIFEYFWAHIFHRLNFSHSLNKNRRRVSAVKNKIVFLFFWLNWHQNKFH